MAHSSKPMDIAGQKFGMWTAVERVPNPPGANRQARWRCVCECGTERVLTSQSVRTGMSKSCGCSTGAMIVAKKTTHGCAGTPTYRAWQAMLSRCRNPKDTSYPRYGAVGITVSEEWQQFENFLSDMGEKLPGMSIERIDCKGNYCKENCIWIEKSKQSRNRSDTIRLAWNGEEKSLGEWAAQLGVPIQRLYQRYVVKGWSAERTLSEPEVHTRGKTTGLEEPSARAHHAVQIALKQGKLTKPSRCQHPGCENEKVNGHHHRGYEEEFHLDVVWLCSKHIPRKHEIAVIWDGKEWSTAELAEKYNLTRREVYKRLEGCQWNITGEHIFTRTSGKRKPRLFDWNGEPKTVNEIVELSGRPQATVYTQIYAGSIKPWSECENVAG